MILIHKFGASEETMAGKNTIKDQMNRWAEAGIPFLFIIDFEISKPLLFPLADIDPGQLLYSINGFTNSNGQSRSRRRVKLVKHPEDYATYHERFSKVRDEIHNGNSYLLNLTCSTPVDLNLSLLEVFHRSRARFKIWYREEFVCFSPEAFVVMEKGKIRSFPMKGTIDASLPDAEKVILNDPKEMAEHSTIVDLIRNDLSMVAEKVRVERFRYLEKINTNDRTLIQVSSEICGELKEGYRSKTGDILITLLPAGSVSGAPKRKTTEIIAAAEKRIRGYYCGVFGLFDGRDLTSAVTIRFIEKRDNQFYYCSGGGITALSDPLSEYREMIDKIYVPIV